MSLHHALRQTDGFQGRKIRIFRNEIRHQHVSVPFHRIQYNGNHPQILCKDVYRYGKGRLDMFFHPEQKEEPRKRNLFVDPPLQEHSCVNRSVDVCHENPEKQYGSKAEKRQKHLLDAACRNNRIDCGQYIQQERPGRDLVDDRSQNAF